MKNTTLNARSLRRKLLRVLLLDQLFEGKRRKPKPLLKFEPLEDRSLLAVFVVNSSLDMAPSLDGNLTLREALTAAITNMPSGDAPAGTPGQDTISFNIGAAGSAHTINLLSELPVITDSVILNAASQPGYAGIPLIELNGAGIGVTSSGLILEAANSEIRGFAINRFSGPGIYVRGNGATENLIAGNFVGTDRTGTSVFTALATGIFVGAGASNNRVGSSAPADRNIASGGVWGIEVTGPGSGNIVQGNYVGTDVSGTKALGNTQAGIAIQSGATGNTIGGDLPDEGNVVSGNGWGIGFQLADSNTVKGNIIGLASDGTSPLPNSEGIRVFDSDNNTIGSPNSKNIISRNSGYGVRIFGSSTGNIVVGNWIGIAGDQTTLAGNGLYGVGVFSPGNFIGRPDQGNIIGGNALIGILVSSAAGNQIRGNRIGVNSNGTPIPNNRGITLDSNSNVFEGNFVSNNTQDGAYVSGSLNTIEGNTFSANGSNGIQIVGNQNIIGTSAGNSIIRNAQNGILITGSLNRVVGNQILKNSQNGVIINGGDQNIIGGLSEDARNIIGDHGDESGVVLQGSSGNLANLNSVAGNSIGVSKDGSSLLPNRIGVKVGAYATQSHVGAVRTSGGTQQRGNLISGNSQYGVDISGTGILILNIAANFIGTNAEGDKSVPNGWGIRVGAGAKDISISGNLVSGNSISTAAGNTEGGGILVDEQASEISISNNRIGTNSDVTAAVANFVGIRSMATNSSTRNYLEISRNFVSGNLSDGMNLGAPDGSGRLDILENVIGLDRHGERISNGGDGIELWNTNDGTTIEISDNTISGNNQNGVRLTGSTGAWFNGNKIGVRPDGRVARANSQHGILYSDGVLIGTNGNGSEDELEGNVISGNGWAAIAAANPSVATTTPAMIRGNKIGTDISGTEPLPNNVAVNNTFRAAIVGFNLQVGTNSDGSSTKYYANTISGNHAAGVELHSGYVTGNLIGVNSNQSESLPNGGPGVVVKGDGVLVSANVIGGNVGAGVWVEGTNAQIHGNYIGTNADRNLALGNQGSGIQIGSASATGVKGNTIGGPATELSKANFIEHNTGAGIRILGENPYNSIEVNQFYGNQGSAIDAGIEVGPTPNRATSRNTQANVPVLAEAYIVNGELTLRGFAEPGATIDFYFASPNPSYFGDGKTHLLRRSEGSSLDLEGSLGTYSNATFSNLFNIAEGTIQANRFEYRVTVASLLDEVRQQLVYGTRLTAVQSGSELASSKQSEFGNSIMIGDKPRYTLPGSMLQPEILLPELVTGIQGKEVSIEGRLIDSDSTDWSAKIEFGDGTSQSIFLQADNQFRIVHQYRHVGDYTATVTVVDNSLAVGIAKVRVVIQNEVPDIQLPSVRLSPSNWVYEGSSISVIASFDDAFDGSHQVKVEWGDGEFTKVPFEPNKEFSIPYTYRSRGANSLKGVGFDLYSVRVSVVDSADASDVTPKSLFIAEVRNVLPTNFLATLSAEQVQVGQEVEITGITFDDLGADDQHQVRVSWGDGTITTENLGQGLGQGLRHKYRSTPINGDSYKVEIQLIDLDQPEQPVSLASKSIKVIPSSVSNLGITPSSTSIAEGGVIQLSGTFSDTDAEQWHRVEINWDDDSNPTRFDLEPGVSNFSAADPLLAEFLTHQYLDNLDPAKIEVKVFSGSDPTRFARKITDIRVSNVAPTLSDLAFSRVGGGTTIVEGDEITLSGMVSDVGALDGHTVTINWGDGVQEEVPVKANGAFSKTHRFIDNASKIEVTARDDEGAASTKSTVDIVVANVPPKVEIEPDSENNDPQLIKFLSRVEDVVGDSNFNYAWTAHPVNQPNNTQTGSSSNFTIDRSSVDSNVVWYVKLTVRDDDFGVGTFEMSMFAGTDRADNIDLAPIIQDNSITGNLMVLGLGGKDFIDGSAITNPAVRLILDGGADDDVLYGGPGPDRSFLWKGNDKANTGAEGVIAGTIANAQGGNDTYSTVPNSTITILDEVGANTLDFGLANFGITFDLSANTTSSFTMQDVAPGAGTAGLHFVSTRGSFAALSGSQYGDTLTGGSNTTLSGGRGNDTFKVKAGTSNARFSGGADNDTVELSGIGLAGISFTGDQGIDTLLNLGTVAGLEFAGGADDDSFVNQGSILELLSFAGDQGADTLINRASIASIVFSGGADNDLFENIGGATIDSLSFLGDDGIDTLRNLGSLETLTFTGGADDDTLENRLGTIDHLTFNGDDGIDQLINLAAIDSLIFAGGADSDMLVNQLGGSIAALNFRGDSGVDELRNLGLLTDLTFNGGADNDRFSNLGNGRIIKLLFNGDSGQDSLFNQGLSVDSLTFSGGADDDRLENLSDIGDLTFTGGADDDLLINRGLGAITRISFVGDHGVDVLSNDAFVSSLTFTGGADDDYLTNLASGRINAIVFNGDAGNDLLRNDGTLETSIQFTGGADDDALLNWGKVQGIVFDGGADDDLLVNRLTGVIGEINFTGDSGADTLGNIGTVSKLTFSGGADDDQLVNYGTLLDLLSFNGDSGADTLENYAKLENVTFNSGADEDRFLNSATGSLKILVFFGDSGNDLLRNLGKATELDFRGGLDDDTLINHGPVDTIRFVGGADDDRLFNQADSVISLSFQGDDGADTLVNRGNGIGTIDFDGGADDETLVNHADDLLSISFEGGSGNDTMLHQGNNNGSLTFNGDDSQSAGNEQGADTLILYGTGTSTNIVTFYGFGGDDLLKSHINGIGKIVFEGGIGDDVFLNFGENVGLLDFDGSQGIDILKNSGAEVTKIEFDGGSESDLFLNDGSSVGSIEFLGGQGNDELLTVGSQVQQVEFTGGDGNDYLRNEGNSVQSIRFEGGADSDKLSNLGYAVEGIEFFGGAGVDQFINLSTGGRSTGLVFKGDEGADRFENHAFEVGTIRFEGGADDDLLLNRGSAVTSLEFQGDSGVNVLVNRASAIDQLNFAGGSGQATLWNEGSRLGTLSFDAESSIGTTINKGNNIQLLQVIGGERDDTLVSFGENITTIRFTANGGDDTLQNNGSGIGLIDFEAGSGHDFLQNNNSVRSINVLGGTGNDRVINNGRTVESIEFIAGADSDSLLQQGESIDTVRMQGNEGDDVLTIRGMVSQSAAFVGGAGVDSFIYEASSPTDATSPTLVSFEGNEGNDLMAWLGSGNHTVKSTGDAGDDIFVIEGDGQIELVGSVGNDYYRLSGSPVANLTIDEMPEEGPLDSSSDTLDFSAYVGGSVNLDLRVTTAQLQSPDFQIRLTNELGIENVYGTQLGDVIQGNSRDNFISGAEFIQRVDLPTISRRAQSQWVWLDFDSQTEREKGEHVYTQAERNEIESRLNTIYHGPDATSDPSTWWFDVRFTQDLAQIAAAMGVLTLEQLDPNSFVTTRFNATLPSGRPGGEASEIDQGNLNFGGLASVQVNGLLGGILAESDEVDEEGTEKTSDNEETEVAVGVRKPSATSENFIALSTKIAAHELGHLLGLRHYDTFGPIGLGIYSTPNSTQYKPNYPGVSGGFEAIDHLLGSGASIGTDRFNDLRPLYFGEREATKLAYAMSTWSDVNFAEQSLSHATLATAQPLDLRKVQVPNTLANGLNEVKAFEVIATSVLGRIDLDVSGKSEEDYYQFSGRKGELVTIELSSLALRDLRFLGNDHWMDSVLRVFDSDGNVVPWYGNQAFSDDEFESSDSILLDLRLPADGQYFIQVGTFARTPGTASYDQARQLADELLARTNLTPDEAAFLDRLLDTLNDTDVGKYHLFLYKFAHGNVTDGENVLIGNGGTDIIIGAGRIDWPEIVASEATTFEFTGSVLDAAGSSWIGTVKYGDGSPSQSLAIDGQGRFTLTHNYSDNGRFEIEVSVVSNWGERIFGYVPVDVSNVAPTASISAANAVYGQTVEVELSDATDIPIDLEAGLRYWFTLDQADFEQIGYSQASSDFKASFAGLDADTYIVWGRVYDKDNGFSEYSTTIEITPFSLAVAAEPKEKIYGSSDPELTYTFAPLVDGDDESIFTGKLSRSMGENTGTFSIEIGTLSAGTNYVIQYFGADFTITPRSLIVTASNQSKEYGNSDPNLTFVFGTLFNGDSSSVFSGSLSRQAGENVGVYAIEQGTLSAGTNYNVSFISSDLRIFAAPLIVTADRVTKRFGDADPSLTFQVAGLKLADSSNAVLSGQLVRNSGESIGVYDILKGSLTANDNYILSFEPSELTIDVRNDFAPEFSTGQSLRFLENLAAEIKIGQLQVTDRDETPLIYEVVSLSNGNIEWLRIDKSANLFVTSNHRFDFESPNEHSLVVRAIELDAPFRSVQATIPILLEDANDPPVALNPVTILTWRLGAAATPFVVIDQDGANGSYQFVTADARFEIREGRLALKSDRYFSGDQNGESISLLIDVTDANDHSSSSILPLTVRVTSSVAWQNPLEPLDVNRDGRVTATDALLIIANLNAQGRRRILSVPRTLEEQSLPDFDTNGDGRVSAFDVLLVIQRLNKNRRPQGEGESVRGLLPITPADTGVFSNVKTNVQEHFGCLNLNTESMSNSSAKRARHPVGELPTDRFEFITPLTSRIATVEEIDHAIDSFDWELEKLIDF